MKILSILLSFTVLGTLVAQGQPAQLPRSTGQVSLRATDKTVRPAKNKTDDKNKGEGVTKTIEVEISAAKSINGPLKIVTCWYGRDMATKKQVMANKHESQATLDAAKTAKATVPPFTFTSTPAKSGKTGKIPASGQDYSGWVIRAYEGATLVGETASSPPLLKLQD